MILIDRTYFVDDLSLPGLTVSECSENVGMRGRIEELTVGGLSLNRFIQKYQSEYLNKILGKELATAFIQGLSEQNPDGIWINLKNQLVDGELKRSPLANYVYFYIMRYGLTFTTPSGEKKGKSDYAIDVSTHKPEFAWNRMVDMNIEFLEWYAENRASYDGYTKGFGMDKNLLTYINIWI